MRAATGRRSFLTASAAGIATGHQVREMALPRGRAAAIVPPPARAIASLQAALPRDPASCERLLLLSDAGVDGEC